MFCCTLLYVHSGFTIMLMGKRELVALLGISSLYDLWFRQDDFFHVFHIIYYKKLVSMIGKYHNHKPQINPWHREEGPALQQSQDTSKTN